MDKKKKFNWYKTLMIVAGIAILVVAVKLVGVPLYESIKEKITSAVPAVEDTASAFVNLLG